MTHLHLSLLTTDLDASVRFYSALFGLRPDKLHDDYARFTVADPPLVLALRPSPTAHPAGRLDHMGLRLPGKAEVGAAEQRLVEAGLHTRPEVGVSCCYAVQDKIWLEDPDGNAWEVYTVLGDAPALAPDSGTCCIDDDAVVATPVAGAVAGAAAAPAASGCCG